MSETLKEKNEINEAENKQGKVKKSNKKKLIILISVIAVIAVAVGIIAVLNAFSVKALVKQAKGYNKIEIENQLVPEKDQNGCFTFTTDKDLKVLQLTDIHIGGGCFSFGKDKVALECVAKLVTAEKPDLVIATGDVAYPIPFASGSFNNKNGAKVFSSLMEQLGVYWTLVFGNHDTEAYSYYNRDEMASFYENSGFKYCVFTSGPEDIYGACNNVIKVRNSKGKLTTALISIDSNDYADRGVIKSAISAIQCNYDNIHEDQIEWYKQQITELKKENENVKSFVFCHIPSVEFKDGWEEIKNNDFNDTENVKYLGGYKGEGVCCPSTDDNFIETVCELGSTKAVLCGHDHVNNYAVKYKDVILSYGYSIDCLAYSKIIKEGSQRGCTVLTCGQGDDEFTLDKYNLYSDRYSGVNGFNLPPVTMTSSSYSYEPSN